MTEQLSRPKRWEYAVSSAKALLEEYQNKLDYVNDIVSGLVEELNEMAAGVNTAVEEIQEIQTEYEDWQSNLPENLADSNTATMLDEVVNIDLTVEIQEIQFEEFEKDDSDEVLSSLEEAENVELPRGFGRD